MACVFRLRISYQQMASGQPPWSEMNFEHPLRALYHIGKIHHSFFFGRSYFNLFSCRFLSGHSDAVPAIPESLCKMGKEFVAQVDGFAFVS